MSLFGRASRRVSTTRRKIEFLGEKKTSKKAVRLQWTSQCLVCLCLFFVSPCTPLRSPRQRPGAARIRISSPRLLEKAKQTSPFQSARSIPRFTGCNTSFSEPPHREHALPNPKHPNTPKPAQSKAASTAWPTEQVHYSGESLRCAA